MLLGFELVANYAPPLTYLQPMKRTAFIITLIVAPMVLGIIGGCAPAADEGASNTTTSGSTTETPEGE